MTIADGSLNNPFHLADALRYDLILPGQTLWLEEGTYSGDFVSTLGADLTSPITIRPMPGKRAIIDGSFNVGAIPWLELLELEIMNSGNTLAWTDGIQTNTLAGKLSVINCVIHDSMGSGCGFWKDVQPGLFYGNIVFYNGRYDYGHCHGLYAQNKSGITKTIKDNIVFDNWGYGIHAYGSGFTDDFDIVGNTIFNNAVLASHGQTNFLLGGDSPFENPNIHENMGYHNAVDCGGWQLGYGVDNPVSNAKINNNYIYDISDAFSLVDCVPVEFAGNTLIGPTYGFTKTDYADNTYLEGKPVSGSRIFVRPNDYQSDRANVTIYNWSHANTVSVNLSTVAGLSVGDPVSVHNVQDYFTDIQTLTLDASKQITINMQAVNRTVSTPIGASAPATTFPEFGCFVIEKV
jgi:hypothetical protein